VKIHKREGGRRYKGTERKTKGGGGASTVYSGLKETQNGRETQERGEGAPEWKDLWAEEGIPKVVCEPQRNTKGYSCSGGN